MVNIIIILILVAVLGFAIWYIVKEKKKGVKCIGCPSAATCAAKQKNGACSCTGTIDKI